MIKIFPDMVRCGNYVFSNPVRVSAAGTPYAENAAVREQKTAEEIKPIERKVEPILEITDDKSNFDVIA